MRLDSDQNGRRSFYERFLSVALDFGSTDMCALCKYTLSRARRSDSLHIFRLVPGDSNGQRRGSQWSDKVIQSISNAQTSDGS